MGRPLLLSIGSCVRMIYSEGEGVSNGKGKRGSLVKQVSVSITISMFSAYYCEF